MAAKHEHELRAELEQVQAQNERLKEVLEKGLGDVRFFRERSRGYIVHNWADSFNHFEEMASELLGEKGEEQ